MPETRDRTNQINFEADGQIRAMLEAITWNWQWNPGIRASKGQVIRELIREEFSRRKLVIPKE